MNFSCAENQRKCRLLERQTELERAKNEKVRLQQRHDQREAEKRRSHEIKKSETAIALQQARNEEKRLELKIEEQRTVEKLRLEQKIQEQRVEEKRLELEIQKQHTEEKCIELEFLYTSL